MLMFLLSACSQATLTPVEGPVQAPYTPLPRISTPTLKNSQTPTDDPIQSRISALFSSSPHTASYSCENCHYATIPIGNELTLLDGETGQFESINTSTDLCLKCHPEQGESFMGNNNNSNHHKNLGCTECHDAHSTEASCVQSSCHVGIMGIFPASVTFPKTHPTCLTDCHVLHIKAADLPIEHQPVHAKIPCTGCHDESKLSIRGPIIQTSSGTRNLEDVHFPWGEQSFSHKIVREVDCFMCHYADNPWGLMVISPES